eukprot:366485-Chlamydomonas_euryale.AAC.19
MAQIHQFNESGAFLPHSCDRAPACTVCYARSVPTGVRVRATGSGPAKGMPVLSAARQRGSSSLLGAN